MKQTIFFLSLIAFIGGLIAAQQYLSKEHTPAASKPIPIAGKQFGGNFSLTQDGKTVSLSDFKGKVVVMYFGYASCPDVCPTSLAMIGGAMKSLTPEELESVQGVFVSVDPERDKGEPLMQYAQYFHKNFVGITGTIDEIKAVTKQYGTYYAKVESDSALSYLVDHTSTTFIIDRDGNFFESQPHGAKSEAIANSIRNALAS